MFKDEVEVCQLNPRYLQRQRSCSIEDDDNVELLLTHIIKIQNIIKSEISAINKTAPFIKAIIGIGKSDNIVKKI